MSTIAATPCLPTLEFLAENTDAPRRDELLPLAEAVIDAVDRALSELRECRQLDDDSILRLTQHVLRTLAAEATAGRLRYAASEGTSATDESPALQAF